MKTRGDIDNVVPTAGGHASGEAVEQVDATIAVLRRILEPNPASALDRARREILQDQLYRAVASGAYTEGERARCVHMLQQLFQAGPHDVIGAIFKVQIASSSSPELTEAGRAYQTPRGAALTVYRVLESEESEEDAPPDDEADDPPPAGEPEGPRDDGGGAADTPSPPNPRRIRRPARCVACGDAEARDPAASAHPARAAQSVPPILLGRSADGQQAYWDPSSTERPLMNFGVLITGDPGSGKTQTIRVLIDGVVKAGLPVCIFDFKNDYAVADFSGPWV